MSVLRTAKAPASGASGASDVTLSKFNQLYEEVIAIHNAYRGPYNRTVECDCILNECSHILYAVESTGDPPAGTVGTVGLRESIADVHARLLAIRNSVMGTTNEVKSDVGIDTLIHEASLINCFLNRTTQPTAVVQRCTLI